MRGDDKDVVFAWGEAGAAGCLWVLAVRRWRRWWSVHGWTFLVGVEECGCCSLTCSAQCGASVSW